MAAGLGANDGDAPSPWIVRFGPLVAPGGTVLDVACGTGRHVRWFERRGHPVTAVDRDAGALAACGATERVCRDLEAGDAGAAWPFHGRRFAGIVVARYLYRPLLSSIVAALAPGGVLLYETFAAGQERFGRPRNPDFLLRPGELLDACRGLSVVAFEDGLDDGPPAASVQRICAIRDVDVRADGRGSAPRHAL